MVKEFLPLRLKYLMTDLSEVPMNTIIPVCEAGGSGVQLWRPPSTRERWTSSVCVHKPLSSCQQVTMCLSSFDPTLIASTMSPSYIHTHPQPNPGKHLLLSHTHTHTHTHTHSHSLGLWGRGVVYPPLFICASVIEELASTAHPKYPPSFHSNTSSLERQILYEISLISQLFFLGHN